MSPSFTSFPSGTRGGGLASVCGHLGEGEWPRLRHTAPLSSSVTARTLHLSLLLPAVTGVPSPRATDPPSHVRPLFFPCVKPAAPSADPVPVSPSRFRAHLYSFGVSRQQNLPFSPISTRSPTVQASHQIPRFPPRPRFPVSRPPPKWPGSDWVTCPFSLQLDGPPAVALGQCPLVGPGPMHRRHLLLPARVRPAAYTHPPAAASASPASSTSPKPPVLSCTSMGLGFCRGRVLWKPINTGR